MFRKYVLNVLVSLDQLINALAGGDPDETISSRSGKAAREGRRWGCFLCRFLSLFERDHCNLSIEPVEGSRALNP